MAEFVLVAPIVLGLIIGLIELFFVHADESGLGWLGHGLHALPATIIFTFISMNAAWVIGLIGLSLPGWLTNIVVPVVIGLVAAIKIKAAAAIAKGGTVGEKLYHALIIGALIAAAPFIWPFIAGMGFLPSWALM